MKKILIIIVLITFYGNAGNETTSDCSVSKHYDIVELKPNVTSLAYKVAWGECRGCNEGLKVVIDVIKNRINSNKFPNYIDTVLLQPRQFYVNTKFVVPDYFKHKVDSLFKQPVKYPFLYFANIDLVINKRNLKWILKHNLTEIDGQVFF